MQPTTLPSAPSPRRLTLMGHIDATPRELEPHETAEIDQFEQAWRPDTQVCMSISRRSKSCARQAVEGGLQIGAAQVCDALAATLGPTGAVFGLASLVLQIAGLRNVIGAGLGAVTRREPAWNGTRVYEVGPNLRNDRIDSPPVAQSASTQPEPAEITSFMVATMKRFPAQVTACMISGHGMAYQSLAGFEMQQWKQVLEDTARQSGRKIDVLVCESCLTGNLEALQMLSGAARYAVVSAQTMRAEGLPWKPIIDSLPAGRLTAEGFARSIVREADKHGAIETLAVIDLQKVAPLMRSVEALGSALTAAVEAGEADAVKAALREAQALGSRNPLSQALFSVRDVGQIADAVVKQVQAPEAVSAAHQVKQACHVAVLTGATDVDHKKSSFISVQGPQRVFDSESYRAQTGFASWGTLLETLASR